MSEKDEDSFMEEACKRYKRLGQKWAVTDEERAEEQVHRVVRKMLEERTGREIPNSTAFSLMARVGRRKFKSYKAYLWSSYAWGRI